MFAIDITNEQSAFAVDEHRLCDAVRMILSEEGVGSALVNVAIVDDPAIHELNRKFLDHDYPTDVLSFVLEQEADRLEGQVVVSAETARRDSERYGWAPADELLLYVIHGTLHLVGYDDQTPAAQAEMRNRERHCLASFGLQPRYDDTDEEAGSVVLNRFTAGHGLDEPAENLPRPLRSGEIQP